VDCKGEYTFKFGHAKCGFTIIYIDVSMISAAIYTFEPEENEKAILAL
jgi:hypothetical protein